MNANKLADYLQNKAEVELRPRLREAATMLRQQQAEIEALNEERNRLWKDKLHPIKELTDEEILISAQYNGIRASEILDEYVIEFARAILRKAGEKCNGFCGEYECKENQSICKRKAQEK